MILNSQMNKDKNFPHFNGSLVSIVIEETIHENTKKRIET